MNSIYRQVRHSGMAAIALTMFALLPGAAPPAQAQTPLKTIDHPEGGKIVYGQVDGANSQAAAMGAVLRAVHNQCGDKPQVGKIYQVRGTNSVAVFFTAVRRAQGDNKAVAGMIIATKVSPNHVEAALVTDDAARFGSTVNPLLRQLFSVWHPGEAPVNAGATPAKTPAPASASGGAAAGHSAQAAALHTVSASDGSATIGIPDGWMLDPHSASGTMLMTGPHGCGHSNRTTQCGEPQADPYISLAPERDPWRRRIHSYRQWHRIHQQLGGELGGISSRHDVRELDRNHGHD
jgi:hypothetical protein